MDNKKRYMKFFNSPSKTKQSFKNECDINLIMKRFKNIHGDNFLDVNRAALGGAYEDLVGIPDYRSAIEQIRRADEVFMALPSQLRLTFNNDPVYFLDFVQDPKNFDHLVNLGLATKRAPNQDAPSQTEVIEKDS